VKSIDLATNRLVLDPAAASDLRTTLSQDRQGGLKQAAQQFEGMLLHLMLKSMRDATASTGLLDSEQSRLFTAIGDQQMALNLSPQMPLGFAGLIEQQLGRSTKGNRADEGAGSSLEAVQPSQRSQDAVTAAAQLAGAGSLRGVPASARAGALPGAAAVAGSASAVPTGPREFVDRVWPHAVEAAAATGVPPRFLVSPSALGGGWGKHEIKASDGSPSFNLFGVKAGRSWSGPTVDVQTSEFVDGVAQPERAKFRVYASYAEAFRDYANLLRSKPRFAGVIGQQDGAQFARSLQQAGYATDPMYAEKIARIIGGASLRQALAT